MEPLGEGVGVASILWLCHICAGHASANVHSLRLNCLSEEELHALEGAERESVEARIGVLRNIQLLLDSAVQQMNQYYAVTGQ